MAYGGFLLEWQRPGFVLYKLQFEVKVVTRTTEISWDQNGDISRAYVVRPFLLPGGSLDKEVVKGNRRQLAAIEPLIIYFAY